MAFISYQTYSRDVEMPELKKLLKMSLVYGCYTNLKNSYELHQTSPLFAHLKADCPSVLLHLANY